MSGLDRLADLGIPSQGEEPESTAGGTSSNRDVAEHMRLYEPIKRGLEMITNNVSTIKTLKEKAHKMAKEEERKAVMSRLDATMSETTAAGQQIKARLAEIQMQNEEYASTHKNEPAKTQMRKNLYSTHLSRFHQYMNEYNTLSHEFKQYLQAQTRRQLRIVDADISEADIEKIVESGHAQGVIKEALLSDDLVTVVKEIEERHLEILKLEQQVLEVYELFRDLATLTELQQEQLDVIETRIDNAKAYTAKADEDLRSAETSQNKARNKTCCLLMILLVIVVIMLSAILGTALKDS